MNAVGGALVLVALAAAVRAIARASAPTASVSALERALEVAAQPATRIDHLAQLERLVTNSRQGDIDSRLRDELKELAAERQRMARSALGPPRLDGDSIDDYVRWLEEP